MAIVYVLIGSFATLLVLLLFAVVQSSRRADAVASRIESRINERIEEVRREEGRAETEEEFDEIAGEVVSAERFVEIVRNLLDETSGPTWIPDHATRVFYEVREIYAVSDASIGKVETRARIQSQEVEV